MSETLPAATSESPEPIEAPAEREFEVLEEHAPEGIVRRALTTNRHFLGIVFGGLAASVRDPKKRPRGLLGGTMRVLAAITRPFLDKNLVDESFAVQLRKRLEILGPTYIKLGQIMSLREDLLPNEITDEFKNLLDRLPAVPYPRFVELVEKEIGKPADEAFSIIDEIPVGSASIGQIHRATTVEGQPVILKMVKPGIRETLKRDVVLLKIFGRLLQVPFGRFQPKRMINEFCEYTMREVDLRLEADNAETFSAAFTDEPDIVFPKIYRDYTTQSLLAMEFFEGIKPNAPEIKELPEEDRDRIIDLGAKAIIRMLYKDGFFHADLHPGNLIITPGPKAAFIDLGMVGRFDDELRRTMLYYYYCMVMGDAENAARYLASVAQPGPGSDVKAFKRDVEEICRRWQRASSFEDFSIGQLIMESVAKGGVHRMYFPVEMVLMVKALITFEGVGHFLKPGFDVAAVSQRHINSIFLHQFSPLRLAKESLRGAPELVDALVKAPMLVTEGLRVLEQTTKRNPENPFAGIRATLLAGFCIVGGAVIAALSGPWYLAAALFSVGVILGVRKGG